MKLHHRYGVLLLAIALLATAAVLGISRWSQRAAPSDHLLSSAASPPKDDAAFHELPRTADSTRIAGGTLASKVSHRPPGTPISEADQPRPGEPTYRMEDLPKACGTYWVADANGGFGRIAVCNPENHPGGSHE
jgi:hypothetical protein